MDYNKVFGDSGTDLFIGKNSEMDTYEYKGLMDDVRIIVLYLRRNISLYSIQT